MKYLAGLASSMLLLACSASPDTGASNKGGTSDASQNSGAAGSGAKPGVDGGARGGAGGAGSPSTPTRTREQPNLVLIFADDMGYGDLSSFGSETIDTPHIDRLAAEGQRWTDFYVASPVCSPSRAALMTGRLPVRNGLYGLGGSRAFFPGADTGIPSDEVTLAEVLRDAGYATGIFGKWHLGDHPRYLPLQHGFERFWGLPYSHDLWNLKLYDNATVTGIATDLSTLTQRYTDHAIEFMRANRDKPFFLYVPHTAPHVPIVPHGDFSGTSDHGGYGDVVEELDYHAGRIIDTLRELELTQDTLVVFTSDHGPWLDKGKDAGSPEPFAGGKFTSREGGFRVPTVFWWPGTIQVNNQVSELGTVTDLFTTFASLAKGTLPDDRVIDGVDLSPVLLEGQKSPRAYVPYYVENRLEAYRRDGYKLAGVHASVQQLYDLKEDPKEQRDLSGAMPDLAEKLLIEARSLDESFEKPASLIAAQ